MKVIGIILICLFFSFGLTLAEEPSLNEQPACQSSTQTPESHSISPGVWLASFFRDHISKVDGDRCPSYPSCSSYSVMAFKKHGFVMGWLMTVDRLIHEGSEELRVSPMIYYNGKMKIYDPVENNDFWWYHPDEKETGN